jgi:hypothetical protein
MKSEEKVIIGKHYIIRQLSSGHRLIQERRENDEHHRLVAEHGRD